MLVQHFRVYAHALVTTTDTYILLRYGPNRGMHTDPTKAETLGQFSHTL